MTYRLGLDLGTNSIGWAVIGLNHNGYPEQLKDAGVRIFSDGRAPKTGTSLAATRTEKRGARRRRDRFIQRRTFLLAKLTALGLLPQEAAEQKALSALNPYQLRTEALDRPLSAHELGRIFVHLNQRRGFKSNRKQGVSEDQDDIKSLKEKLMSSNSRTLGEFLYKELQKISKPEKPKDIGRGTTRARKGEGLYPERSHYEHEFSEIQKTQQKHHNLTNKDWEVIHNIIFNQRPLAEQPRGKCQLMYNEGKERVDAALPSAEMFVALQNLNNLGWREKGSARDYTMLRNQPEQWQTLWDKLQNQKTAPKFDTVKSILFGKTEKDSYEFNLETGGKREKLEALQTANLLKKPEYFDTKWPEDIQQQDHIVETILKEPDPEKLAQELQQKWGLAEANAKAVAELDDSKFKSGTARFCKEALYGMLPHLLERKTYWAAAEALGFDTRGEQHDNSYDKLPYYAEALPDVAANSGQHRRNKDEQNFGIINNPTVHIALNQLRKVVNELIKIYGKPESIHVELARDLKMNKKEKAKLEKQQKDNQAKNKTIAEELERITRKHGTVVEDTYTNRLRYKLWQEQNHVCPFSGEKICISKLFSNAFEIEHILPFSRTLDDSPANKVVALREANRKKGNRTPFEAFGHEKAGSYAYDLIRARVEAENFPANKRWRFEPEAMEKFEKDNNFLKRQLHDTQYLSKVAARYLSCICPAKKVVASPGRLTAKLRHHWGLNSIIDDNASEKDRTDHRHHAIDATVVALTDYKMLQEAAKANKTVGIDDDRLNFPCPVDAELLREQAKTAIGENLVVAHRPDHGTQGQLHKDGNYGEFKPCTDWEREKSKKYNLVRRKPIVDLSIQVKKGTPDIELIRDPLIREEIRQHIALTPKHEIDSALVKFTENRAKEGKPIHSVRILEMNGSAQPITHIDSQGDTHKKHVIPSETHHLAIWKLPPNIDLNDDKTCEKYTKKGYIPLAENRVAEIVKIMKANQIKHQKDFRPHPEAKRELKLHKGDMIQLEHKNKLVIGKITSIKENQQIFFVKDNAAGKKPETASFMVNALSAKKVKKLHVTPAGKILGAR